MNEGLFLYKEKRLTIRYIIALSLVALFSVSSYLIIQIVLSRQNADARVINLSGRQRMLSQMLTKETLLLAQSENEDDRMKYHSSLDAALQNWRMMHEALRHGNEELKIPAGNSPEIEKYFTQIDQPFQNIVNAAGEILAIGPSGSSQMPLKSPTMLKIVESSPQYLEWMDKIVFQYQKEADERVSRLQYLETLFLSIILMILSLEAVFIFRPMVAKVKKSYESLISVNNQLAKEIDDRKKAEKQLQDSNDRLEAQVMERTSWLSEMNEELKKEINERARAERILRDAYEDLKKLQSENVAMMGELDKSLHEKELLLRELHHRVKNNLQIISSLIRIQSKSLPNGSHTRIFKDSENRIMSMALVHEKLYKSKDLAHIAMKDYVRDIINSLAGAYDSSNGRISFQIEVDDIFMNVDSAIPCGLVLNELISNSMKHAFVGVDGGRISVRMAKGLDDQIELTVNDNGKGLRPEGHPENEGSIGLELVRTIVEDQLRGTMAMDSGGLAEFKISFREPNYRKRI